MSTYQRRLEHQVYYTFNLPCGESSTNFQLSTMARRKKKVNFAKKNAKLKRSIVRLCEELNFEVRHRQSLDNACLLQSVKLHENEVQFDKQDATIKELNVQLRRKEEDCCNTISRLQAEISEYQCQINILKKRLKSQHEKENSDSSNQLDDFFKFTEVKAKNLGLEKKVQQLTTRNNELMQSLSDERKARVEALVREEDFLRQNNVQQLQQLTAIESKLAELTISFISGSDHDDDNTETLLDDDDDNTETLLDDDDVWIREFMSLALPSEKLSSLAGLMQHYTEVFSKQPVDSNWKERFVNIVTEKLAHKLRNATDVAQRLVNNPSITIPQDNLDSVHADKTKFLSDEINCLKLICASISVSVIIS
uniref:GRIP domain-containing protein n=1 Tax=Panagrellus redivivus TaxID=6233 RepID=A0A7E4VYQ4_PANRE